jgi:hypothetical protein
VERNVEAEHKAGHVSAKKETIAAKALMKQEFVTIINVRNVFLVIVNVKKTVNENVQLSLSTKLRRSFFDI